MYAHVVAAAADVADVLLFSFLFNFCQGDGCNEFVLRSTTSVNVHMLPYIALMHAFMEN